MSDETRRTLSRLRNVCLWMLSATGAGFVAALTPPDLILGSVLGMGATITVLYAITAAR